MIVAIVKWLVSGSSSNQRREKTALDILKERYARSEIDREAFEQKCRYLKN